MVNIRDITCHNNIKQFVTVAPKINVITLYYYYCSSHITDLWACHGSWICVLILCLSMWVDCSLCLSALPSDRAPDEVIRTVTGVARLVVRCQIVFTLVVSLLSVSVFQVLRLFSPDRVSVFP